MNESEDLRTNVNDQNNIGVGGLKEVKTVKGGGETTTSSTTNPPAPAQQPPPSYVLHYSLVGHKKSVSSVKFSPDGQWLASSCKLCFEKYNNVLAADKTVKLWGAYDGKYEKTLEGHTGGISDLAWAGDSLHVCTAADDKTVRIWNIATVSSF